MTALLAHPAVLAALAYLAATLLFQFRPFSTRLLGLDPFGILPRWKFFIPQPERVEIALALRSGPSEGALGAWRPVPMFPPRHALSWLWFPEGVSGSVLLLSAHRLAAQVQRGHAPAVPDTLAYRTLARHVRRLADADGHAVFQFGLVQPNDRPLFTSPVRR